MEKTLKEIYYNDYINHQVFNLIKDIKTFYDFLSFNNRNCNDVLFVKNYTDISPIIFDSIKESVISIEYLLKKKKINDAFTLIRKYKDSVVTDINLSILKKEEQSKLINSFNGHTLYKLYNNNLSKWSNENNKLDIEATLSKIYNYSETKELNNLLIESKITNKGKPYYILKNGLIDKGSNNVHYNSLLYFKLNTDFIDENRLRFEWLNYAYNSIKRIMIFHFSYILFFNPEYYRSTDYEDELEFNIKPIENSENYISPYIQELFNKYISENKDLATYLKECNYLCIE